MNRFRRGDERGFTVIEMMVGIFVLALVIAMMYRGLSALESSASGTQQRFSNLDEARLLMATTTKDLRAAVRLTPTTSPFTYAASRQVTFYASIKRAEGPHRINMLVDADNRLISQDVAPGGVAPNFTYLDPPTARAVAGPIATTGTIFTYYDDAGVALSTPVSASNLLRIAAVEITVSVGQSSSSGIRPVTLVNRVRLPNVYYNPLGT